ncbi:hypothetical protein HRbin04_00025 [archaeon HR04]|nr:hypothetical protein HRbin04_00025 [archaeon HR04]
MCNNNVEDSIDHHLDWLMIDKRKISKVITF